MNYYPDDFDEYDNTRTCQYCGKDFEDFSDLGCEYCDVRYFYHAYDCICENCLQVHPERDLLYGDGTYFTYPDEREEVRKKMKLTATVVAAFAGLVYAIMRAYAPELPFTADQVLTVILLALAWLGVTVTEEQVRAWFVRRGFNGFK